MKRAGMVAAMMAFIVFISFAFDSITQASVYHDMFGITPHGLSAFSVGGVMGAVVFSFVSSKRQFIAALFGAAGFILQFGSIRLSHMLGEPQSWWWLVPYAMAATGTFYELVARDEQQKVAQKAVA